MGEVDAALEWLRVHLGSTLFGAIIGWMLRSMIDPPASPLMALRNIVMGVGLAVVLARPLAQFFAAVLDVPAELLVEASAAVLAISGEHAIYGIQRFMKSRWINGNYSSNGNDGYGGGNGKGRNRKDDPP